jgi:hypothetical protein
LAERQFIQPRFCPCSPGSHRSFHGGTPIVTHKYSLLGLLAAMIPAITLAQDPTGRKTGPTRDTRRTRGIFEIPGHAFENESKTISD